MSDDSLTIDAAVATAAGAPFVPEQLALRAPGASEILVRLVATSVCHTDVFAKVNDLCPFPIVLGHEGAGIIEAIGSDVDGFSVGDHVVLSYDACGQCAQCHKDKPGYCDNHAQLNFGGERPDGSQTHQRSDGTNVTASFFQQSSFATYALSHASNTIKVDKSLPLATLTPLGCGVQTGAGTVFNTLDVEAGSSIAVFGCGCVGLSAVMAAKVAGAKHIVAVDIQAARLDMARELGATATINPPDIGDDDSIVGAVQKTAGSLNYAIDTTGNADVLRQAFDCCGPMGITAMIAPGLPGTEVTIDTLGLLPGKVLRGVIQGDSISKTFIPRMIELWQDGRFPFDRMITTFNGIDQLDTAVNAMHSGEVIKPVVIFDDPNGATP